MTPERLAELRKLAEYYNTVHDNHPAAVAIAELCDTVHLLQIELKLLVKRRKSIQAPPVAYRWDDVEGA